MAFMRFLSILSVLVQMGSCGEDEGSSSSASSTTFEARCLVTLKSSDSKTCIDYRDLNSTQLNTTESACASSDQEDKVFEASLLCDSEGKIGGCQLPKSRGVTVTTWTYQTGDDSVDSGLKDLAMDACAASDGNGVSGVWVDN